MRTLIKLGGTLLDQPAKVAAIAGQLARAAADGYEIAIVHGGGKQVTKFLEERGVESRFQGGLRVSDATVIDAVLKVIAGTVNKRLVAAVQAAGRPAIGLSGVDGALTQAVPMSTQLEFVGRPTTTDGRLLELLTGAGYTPVVACVAGDDAGNIYNVNADAMAVSCALGWPAQRIFFLTDVAGVNDGSGKTLQRLGLTQMRDLIASGVAHGGMQAKLESAALALQAGLEVTIALGSADGVCQRLLAGEAFGTRLEPAVGVRA